MTRGAPTRRELLRRAVVGAAALTTLTRRASGEEAATPETAGPRCAIIGAGAHARSLLAAGRCLPMPSAARLVAICDVDRRHLTEALALAGPGVAGTTDHRAVLGRDDVDIVYIATPPHWHAKLTVEAALTGKDIVCETPMAPTTGEARRMLDAVERYGRLFRLSLPHLETPALHGVGVALGTVEKIARHGVLGWPLRLRLGPASGFTWRPTHLGRVDLAATPVPPELDWEAWLGPAPWRAYHPLRAHGHFRGYWDYAGGVLGDSGQNGLDAAQRILGKVDTSPVEARADAPPQHPEAVGVWRRVRLRYEDGCEIILETEDESPDAPFIEGPQGRVWRGLRSDVPRLRDRLAELPGAPALDADLDRCWRERRPGAADIATSFRSAALTSLAKTAIRVGRTLRVDPRSATVLDDPAAQALETPLPRSAWRY